jgi:hypothetical protein
LAVTDLDCHLHSIPVSPLIPTNPDPVLILLTLNSGNPDPAFNPVNL